MSPFIRQLGKQAIDFLQILISIPSFSKEEKDTAVAIYDFLRQKKVDVKQIKNNIWALNASYDKTKPTILINSHHDTVKPNQGYTLDPFKPTLKDNKLYGLGSNDAGGCLVSLMAVFLFLYDRKDMSYNILFIASAEEEISGKEGISLVLDYVKKQDIRIAFALVGEPTCMHMAIAEKGLMVLDGEAIGKAGHAAREEGINALYIAMKDIEWFRTYCFDKESKVLGPIKMTVTHAETSTKQHNVVPCLCRFTVDVRTTDVYTNQEVLKIIKAHTQSTIRARSTRLSPSSIDVGHPIVQEAIRQGIQTYGSPTMSDQALISVPSFKMGPGDSARSHIADEYIYIDEIYQGIERYISLIETIL